MSDHFAYVGKTIQDQPYHIAGASNMVALRSAQLQRLHFGLNLRQQVVLGDP